ncbi:MAG: hypothetical protein LBS73_02295 [Campylobacteraceae bacterium]|jgi:hypothetical protein|nr:hypothetical protein [Campylobacteraceae bacterium]
MKRTRFLSAFIITIATLFVGCGLSFGVMHIKDYTPTKSGKGMLSIKKMDSVKIRLGNFTAANPKQNSVKCDTARISLPEKQNFETYIKNAFAAEFKAADMYDENAQITLYGHINEIYSMIKRKQWIIDITITSSNGKSFNPEIQYPYIENYEGKFDCDAAANTFNRAVKQLIYKMVNDKEFLELLEVPKKEEPSYYKRSFWE